MLLTFSVFFCFRLYHSALQEDWQTIGGCLCFWGIRVAFGCFRCLWLAVFPSGGSNGIGLLISLFL